MNMGSVRIERLDGTHNRNLFDCGEESLNTYLRKQAGQEERKFISSVYVAVPKNIDSSEVMGFYTLSAAQIELSEVPAEMAQTLPRYPFLPAFRVGRLAVNKTSQNMGIGRQLLLDALLKCFRSEVSSFAVIMDAKNEQVIPFYQKYGFIQLPEQPLKLFIPMKVVRNLFGSIMEPL